MRSTNGQVLPLALVLVLIFAALWVMTLNVGKLIKDRLQLQMAADASAQTVAAFRARGLNIAGFVNSWLGIPGVAIGSPLACFWPAPPHKIDRGVFGASIGRIRKMLAAAKNFSQGNSDDKVEAILEGLLTTAMVSINFAYDEHPDSDPNMAKKQQQFIDVLRLIQTHYVKTYGGGYALAKGREIARLHGADDVYIPPHSFSLHLRRNRGSIWYLGTIHVWTPYNTTYPFVLPSTPAIKEEDENTSPLRWLEQGPQFWRQNVRVYAFRRAGSALNQPFPLGRRVFSVTPNDLVAAASARVFNPDGPLFPTENEGPLLAPGWAATSEYTKAQKGYRAQLTPLGGLYEH